MTNRPAFSPRWSRPALRVRQKTRLIRLCAPSIHRLQARGRSISRWTTWPICLRNPRSMASIWILSAIRIPVGISLLRRREDAMLALLAEQEREFEEQRQEIESRAIRLSDGRRVYVDGDDYRDAAGCKLEGK